MQLCRLKEAALYRMIAMRMYEICSEFSKRGGLLCDMIVGIRCSLQRVEELVCSAILTAY